MDLTQTTRSWTLGRGHDYVAGGPVGAIGGESVSFACGRDVNGCNQRTAVTVSVIHPVLHSPGYTLLVTGRGRALAIQGLIVSVIARS